MARISSAVLSISQRILRKVPDLHVETLSVPDITVKRTHDSIVESKKYITVSYKGKTFEDIKNLTTFKAYRRIHDQIGAYPDNAPPAVENLYLRGVLQGKVPTINNVVDACNMVSIISQIPIGIFDRDKIVDKLKLRLANEGEAFTPICKTKLMSIPEGVPILLDQDPIISILGVKDSDKTKITKHTKNLLLISWGNKDIPSDILRTVLEEATHLITCSK